MTELRSPSPDLLVLGRGVVRWAPIVNGVRKPIRDLGNVEELSLGTADTKLKKQSFRSGINATYKEIATDRTITISIKGEEFDPDTIAAILQGEAVAQAATAGGIITTEVHAALGQGYGIIQLAHPLVSVVVLTHPDADPDPITLEAGTDYEIVDAARGLIRIIEGGDNFDPALSINAAYHWAAQAAGVAIRGGTLAVVEGSLFFAANNATGPNRDLFVPRCSFTSDGDLGFLTSTDIATWGLKGTVLEDSAGDFGGSEDSPLYTLTPSPVADA